MQVRILPAGPDVVLCVLQYTTKIIRIMSKIFLPPAATPAPQPNLVNVFLAGSIEMGVAEEWQTRVGNKLAALEGVGQVFNPRRTDWDSSWVQSIENEQFNTQVNWEVDHIEASNIIYMYFDKDTKSPITLLELGYILGRQRTFDVHSMHRRPEIIVVCPDGFWRQGNVEIMCDRADRIEYAGFKTEYNSGVHFFRDVEKGEEFLIRAAWMKHKSLSNFYDYFPHITPFDSQREIKMYRNETRGTKVPKGWVPPEKDE